MDYNFPRICFRYFDFSCLSVLLCQGKARVCRMIGKYISRKKEETALQSSCVMATYRCGLSTTGIDLNALILQRREATYQ